MKIFLILILPLSFCKAQNSCSGYSLGYDYFGAHSVNLSYDYFYGKQNEKQKQESFVTIKSEWGVSFGLQSIFDKNAFLGEYLSIKYDIGRRKTFSSVNSVDWSYSVNSSIHHVNINEFYLKTEVGINNIIFYGFVKCGLYAGRIINLSVSSLDHMTDYSAAIRFQLHPFNGSNYDCNFFMNEL